MKIKNIIYSVALLAAGLSAVSCQTEEQIATNTKVDKAVLNFEKDGGSQTVTVTSDNVWNLKDITAGNDWITVDPKTGNGTTKVTITVNKFNASDDARTATISFENVAGKAAGVTINQKWAAPATSVEYNKVSAVADGKKYLIVADTGKELLAAIPLEHSNESTYNYIYGTAVTDDGGKITASSAANSLLFTKTAKGFAISGPDGRYLFQASGYANFYTTADLSKADSWSVTFDGGKATIKNVTVDATGKYLQYDNVKYYDFGAWPTLTDGYVQSFSLYEEVEDPNAPKINVKNPAVNITAYDTKATFSVDANDAWVIISNDGKDWAQPATDGAAGKADLNFVIKENTTGADRTAKITLKGSGITKDITITQTGAIFKNIAEMNAALTSSKTNYALDLKDAVVNYTNGGTFFLQDGTGAVCGYISNHGYNAGDVLNGKAVVTGYLYNNLPEITALSGVTSEAGTAPEPVVVTLKDLLAYYNLYLSMRVKIEGVKITDAINADGGDRNGKISQGDSQAILYSQQKTGIAITANSEGDVIVTPSVYKTDKQLGIWAQEDFDCKLQGTTITAPSALEVKAGETGTIEATASSRATLEFASSDETVATVSAAGVVTGLKGGNCVITITAPQIEGFAAATAEVKVTVTEGPAPVKTTYKLTNEEIVATMAAFDGTSGYMDYTIASTDGDWTGNMYVNKTNTYLQLRNKSGAFAKSPEYSTNVKKVTLTISSKTIESRTFHIIPADTAVPTSGDNYTSALWENEYGSFKTTTRDSQVTADIEFPSTAAAKQFIIVMDGGAAYLDAITVEVE